MYNTLKQLENRQSLILRGRGKYHLPCDRVYTYLQNSSVSFLNPVIFKRVSLNKLITLLIKYSSTSQTIGYKRITPELRSNQQYLCLILNVNNIPVKFYFFAYFEQQKSFFLSFWIGRERIKELLPCASLNRLAMSGVNRKIAYVFFSFFTVADGDNILCSLLFYSLRNISTSMMLSVLICGRMLTYVTDEKCFCVCLGRCSSVCSVNSHYVRMCEYMNVLVVIGCFGNGIV